MRFIKYIHETARRWNHHRLAKKKLLMKFQNFDFDGLKSKLDGLNSKLDEAASEIRAIREQHASYAQATFFNLLALSSPESGPLTLYTPWDVGMRIISECGGDQVDIGAIDSRGSRLLVNRHEDGRLCFKWRDGATSNKPKICLYSVMKSGTNLLMDVLTHLDFKLTGTFSLSGKFIGQHQDDNEPVPTKARKHDWNVHHHVLPTQLQMRFLRNGDLFTGHIDSDNFLGKSDAINVLLLIRDMRTTIISLARFLFKNDADLVEYPKCEDIPEEYYCRLMNTDLTMLINQYKAAMNCMTRPECHVIRYEDVLKVKHGGGLATVKNISDCAGCDDEAVINSIKHCLDVKGIENLTYTGCPSSLKKCWSAQMEKIFVSKRWDELNEQMGYGRLPELDDNRAL